MIWVAWRQQRLPALISIGLVLMTIAALVFVRLDAASLLPNQDAVGERYKTLPFIAPLFLLALPVLLGMFAGAPLFAREVEQGTHLFVLTQSISRIRWWATKLAVGALPVTLAMTALGLVGAWAFEPLNFLLSSRLRTPLFEIQGTAIGAYTALAFAIGATAGLLVRGTLGAMAITLVGYIVVMVLVGNAGRPQYATPLFVAEPAATSASDIASNAWVVDRGYLSAAGREISVSPSTCTGENVDRCFADHGIVQRFTRFQPDDRFWQFQLVESVLFLLLAAGFIALGAWALRWRVGP